MEKEKPQKETLYTLRGRRDNHGIYRLLQSGVGGKDMAKKRKTLWAYLDGKKLVDVVQAALDNDMMVDDMKAALIIANPDHKVTFKVKEEA